VGKDAYLAVRSRIMPRKTPKKRQEMSAFPAHAFWEELSPSWEGDLGKDRLGADHKGRQATVAMVMRKEPLEIRLRHGDIPREAFVKLVSVLQVPDPETLTDRLEEIAGRHLRPAHRLLLGTDPRSTQSALLKVMKAAQTLDDLLDNLAPVVTQYLDEFHASLPADERKLPALHVDAIHRSLSDLAMLCARASNELYQVANAPVLALRRQTLKDAVAAIEQHTGRQVRTRWSRGDKKCSEFREREGKVLRMFMRLVEPSASERVLVRLFREMRSEQRRSQSTPKH
jgi:hypothetical protein